MPRKEDTKKGPPRAEVADVLLALLVAVLGSTTAAAIALGAIWALNG